MGGLESVNTIFDGLKSYRRDGLSMLPLRKRRRSPRNLLMSMKSHGAVHFTQQNLQAAKLEARSISELREC